MKVTRCICFRRTFAELQEVAQATDAKTLAELQAHVLFGKSCMLCVPYVREMLKTGKTEFDVGEVSPDPLKP